MRRLFDQALPLRPAAAFLSKSALARNIRLLQSWMATHTVLHHPRAEIMAMVKADAYGHSVEQILPELQRLGVKRFAVASLQEGAEARRISTSADLLVLGGTLQWSRDAKETLQRYGLETGVNDLEALKFFIKHPEIPIHLKLDTGMGRLGLRPEDWAEAVQLLKKSKRKLEGIFTHYATSQDRIFHRQAMLFEEGMRLFVNAGVRPRFVHSENSAALLGKNDLRKGIVSELGNLIRPGISMYGYLPRGLKKGPAFEPVLELVSRVELVKRVDVGEGISYGHLYKSKKRHDYAVVPLGYADGLSKTYAAHLEPAWFSASGKPKGSLRICGAICMDMVMLRAQNSSKKKMEIEVGDRVKFWGRFPNAVLAERIVEPYELNLRIAKRIPRIWVD